MINAIIVKGWSQIDQPLATIMNGERTRNRYTMLRMKVIVILLMVLMLMLGRVLTIVMILSLLVPLYHRIAVSPASA